MSILLVAVALVAPSSRGQTAGFASGFGGVGSVGDDVRAAASSAGRSAAAGSVDASALLGLEEPAGGRRVLTLDEALALVGEAPEARIADERVTQQEAARRRAWALLLPTLSLSGIYTHTCTGGLEGVDCADRVANVVDPETVEQQALLFESLADIFRAAADAAPDPDDEAAFRAQEADLRAAAQSVRKSSTAEPVVVQPASQLAGQLSLSLPIFNPRAYPAVMNASDGVDAAALGAQHARQTLAFAVVRAYYAAWTAQRLVQASERQVELSSKQRDAVAARVAAATQPPLALKRAELELLRARQTLSQARAGADNAIATLGAALGQTTMFSVAEPPAVPAPVLATAAEQEVLVERARAQRLDLRVQRAAFAIAERGTLDAWMQFLPTVGVQASARATSFTSGFVRDPITGTLSVTATLPLYDGGLRYAALDEAIARANEERTRLRQLEDRVAAQVRGNLRDVAVREEAAALAHEALAVARQALEQAQALFDAGVGTALDVSDTSFAVFSAETEALRADAELALARLALRWAVGDPLTGGPASTP